MFAFSGKLSSPNDVTVLLKLLLTYWTRVPWLSDLFSWSDTSGIGMKLIVLYSHNDAGFRKLLLDMTVTQFKSDIRKKS